MNYPNAAGGNGSDIRATAPVGFTALGAFQKLRPTVVNRDNKNADIRFGQQQYTQEICNGGVCRHSVSSQNVSNPIRLMPGEAASIDDSVTGEIVSYQNEYAGGASGDL
ncbi:MAG TPA: hypothetical protein VGC97_09045 [Pyrinomonadaceae bacterium]